MKNKEKFAKEIIEIALDGSRVAVDKATGKPVGCNNIIGCDVCALINKGGCSTALKEWAESEYIEKPVISKTDRMFLDYLDVCLHYIARSAYGVLYAYINKPRKSIDCWEKDEYEANKSLLMFNIDFQMVKWTDEEPWLIEDLKKLEVVEEYEK